MKEAAKRAVRTFIQALLGALLSSGVLSAIQVDGVVHASALAKAGVSALAAGVIALLTFIQNALEDTGTVKPFLK